jgi:hypothetical protein
VIQEDEPHLRRVHWVRYEDLAGDPLGTLREISEFVGVGPYLEAYLPRSISVHERNEAVSDLNAESIQRLSPDDIRIVTEIAAPQLEEYGYPLL